jgi:hypothetical protein
MVLCDCPVLCKGGKDVAQRTYRDHAKYRTPKLSADFNQFIASETSVHAPRHAASVGTSNPSDRDLECRSKRRREVGSIGGSWTEHGADPEVRAPCTAFPVLTNLFDTSSMIFLNHQARSNRFSMITQRVCSPELMTKCRRSYSTVLHVRMKTLAMCRDQDTVKSLSSPHLGSKISNSR